MNMVEKVAAAMAAADNWNLRDGYYLRQARVAIAAMREPTDKMVMAGAQTIAAVHERKYDYHPAKTAWQEMIDAALTP